MSDRNKKIVRVEQNVEITSEVANTTARLGFKDPKRLLRHIESLEDKGIVLTSPIVEDIRYLSVEAKKISATKVLDLLKIGESMDQIANLVDARDYIKAVYGENLSLSHILKFRKRFGSPDMTGEDIIEMVEKAIDSVPDYVRLGRAYSGITNVMRVSKESYGSITQLDMAVELLNRHQGNEEDDGIINSINEEE